MKKITGCLIIIVVSFLVFPVRGQDSLHFVSATTGAACQVIKKYGNFLVTGTGSTLRIYNATTAIPYELVWEYRYSSAIDHLLIKEHYLYVAANYDGLTKWDISNPVYPQKVFEICRAVNSEQSPVLDVDIAGDTLFLARFSKVSVYKDYGNHCEFITDFGAVSGTAKILGVKVKNEIVAYTVADLFSQNGVYLYNTHSYTPLGFYHQSYCWPENVIWGKNNNLLHVLGGTNGIKGYYYSLDISNPSTPLLVYCDTIAGIPLMSVGNTLNAENINDTIYVATTAGLKPEGPLDTAYVRVYDATDPSEVHLINYLPAGLWHFDVAVDPLRYYVASEWYGILTGDISNFTHPVVLGLTRTGGWNTSSDKSGNYLAIANEGYGFKLYDIHNIKDPLLTGINNAPGFCQRIRFSADGNYIYASYMTTKGFRVFRCPSLEPMDSLSQFPGLGKMQVCRNRVFIQNPINNKINILNVSNPSSVFIDTTLSLRINDMMVSDEKLFITTNDNILVYDIALENLNLIASENMSSGQTANELGAYGDTVFVYVKSKGLVKYHLTFTDPGYSLVEQNTWTLSTGEPTLMAADTFGLYLSYRMKGLFFYDPESMNLKNYYRGELDYKGYPNQWGVQELYCKDKLTFLTEYFSQTTILSSDNKLNPGIDPPLPHMLPELHVFPNPSEDIVRVKFKDEPSRKLIIQLFDITGKSVMEIHDVRGGEVLVDLKNLSGGMYFISLKENGTTIAIGKFAHIE